MGPCVRQFVVVASPGTARFLLAALMVVISLAAARIAHAQTVEVKGCVTDWGGKPYQGVKVELVGVNYDGGDNYTTDDQGEFSLRMKPGEPGRATVARLLGKVDLYVTPWTGKNPSGGTDVWPQDFRVSNTGKPVDLRPRGCIRFPYPIDVGGQITSESLEGVRIPIVQLRLRANEGSLVYGVEIPATLGGPAPFSFGIDLRPGDQFEVDIPEQPNGAECSVERGGSGKAGMKPTIINPMSFTRGTNNTWLTSVIAVHCKKGPVKPEEVRSRLRPDKPLLSVGGRESSTEEIDAFNRAWDEKEEALYELGERMVEWGTYNLQTIAGRAAFLKECDERIARARERRSREGVAHNTQKPPSEPNHPNPNFDVVNRSQKVITGLYVSSPQSSTWGTDLLPGVINPGERFFVRLPRDGQCVYDLRAAYADKTEEERRRVDVCKIDEMAFTGASANVSKPAPVPPTVSAPTVGNTQGTFNCDAEIQSARVAFPKATEEELSAAYQMREVHSEISTGFRFDDLHGCDAGFSQRCRAAMQDDAGRKNRNALAYVTYLNLFAEITLSNARRDPGHEGLNVKRRLQACYARMAAAQIGQASNPQTGAAPRTQTTNAPDPDFHIANRAQDRTAKVITRLYVSSAQSNSWGEDLLPGVLKPDERFLVKLPRSGQCVYDVRVVYADKTVEERRKEDVCKISEMAFSGANARADSSSPASSQPQNASATSSGRTSIPACTPGTTYDAKVCNCTLNPGLMGCR